MIHDQPLSDHLPSVPPPHMGSEEAPNSSLESSLSNRRDKALERFGGRRPSLGGKVLLGGAALASVLTLSPDARKVITDIGSKVEQNYDNHNTNTDLPDAPTDMVVEVPAAPAAP